MSATSGSSSPCCRRRTAASPSCGGSSSCCAACCPRSSPSPWACSSAPCSAATASIGPLAFIGVVFVLLQVLTPIQTAVSDNLGDRTAAWLYDRLTDACVRPPGMGHLEDPKLTNDLTVARDFDLGMTGPPLSISMDFIAGGLVEMIGGLASAAVLVRLRVVGAARARRRLAGHALAAARERGLARPQHRRGAQRAARRRLRLPARRRSARQQGAAAVRPGRLDDRPLHRPPHDACTSCSTQATRLRERSGASGACCSSSAPTWSCSGRWPTRRATAASTSASSSSSRRRGRHVADRVRRAELGARRRGGAGRRGAAPRAGDGARRRAVVRRRAGRRPARARDPVPRRDLRLSRAARRCSTASTSRSPPARRSPSSGRTAPARRRSPSCCAGSTTRRPAPSRSTASTCASSTSTSWRSRVTAVFQDFIRFELPLRDNVAPGGAPDDVVLAALEAAGARARRLDTVLARGYDGRHRPVGRAVAAGRAGAGAVRRAARRGRRAARRADRAARRARRGGDLRARPGRDAPLHDDPDLAPLLDRAPRRPHLRARARQGGRARHPRRADGARAAATARCSTCRPSASASPRTRRGRRYDVLV